MADHDFSTFTAPLAHPGEHLHEDYLPEGGISPTGLTELFDTPPEFWLNLQAAHDASSQALEDNSAVSLSQAND